MFGQNFDPFNQQQNRPRAGTPTGKPADDKKKKRNQVLRFMFHPELGNSFHEVTEGHVHFVRLIGNLFLQTGLVDATYPGFSDPAQMKLVTLIRTAYNNLEFTREGLPRVLLFAAFVGSMAAVIVAVLLFFLTVAAPVQQKMPTPPAS